MSSSLLCGLTESARCHIKSTGCSSDPCPLQQQFHSSGVAGADGVDDIRLLPTATNSKKQPQV